MERGKKYVVITAAVVLAGVLALLFWPTPMTQASQFSPGYTMTNSSYIFSVTPATKLTTDGKFYFSFAQITGRTFHNVSLSCTLS